MALRCSYAQQPRCHRTWDAREERNWCVRLLDLIPSPLTTFIPGRFGSDFVENRRSALQSALMKIVSHPMLVGDPDLRLFLESDSFSVDVRTGFQTTMMGADGPLGQIKQRKMDSPSESKGFFGSLGTSISGPKFVEFDEVRSPGNPRLPVR